MLLPCRAKLRHESSARPGSPRPACDELLMRGSLCELGQALVRRVKPLLRCELRGSRLTRAASRDHSQSLLRHGCGKLRDGETMRIIIPLIFGLAAACVPLDSWDPVVYVDGQYCTDRDGTPQQMISGYVCCPNGGQCPEDLYCYGIDECRGPIPPNDELGAPHAVKRRTAF